MSWEPVDRSNISVHWFSQQPAGKKVGWHHGAWTIFFVLIIKQFLFVRQLEYSDVDVVQLRFMQFHSLTSFQHMTIRCTSSQASVLGTANSMNGLIHLLGNSGKELGSRLITVNSGDGEVRFSELCNNFGLKVLCLIRDSVANVELSPHWKGLYVLSEYFPDSGGCESSRKCRATSAG